MTSLLKAHWRAAREPGNGRAGKPEQNGLEAHLALVHGYAATRLWALTVLQLVFKHQNDVAVHPHEHASQRR